jgi:hypothetical protein
VRLRLSVDERLAVDGHHLKHGSERRVGGSGGGQQKHFSVGTFANLKSNFPLPSIVKAKRASKYLSALSENVIAV